MKLRTIRWKTFSLPLQKPFLTVYGSLSHREGVIIWLEDNDGIIGVGECSPLQSRGNGDVAEIVYWLQQFAPRLVGCDINELRDGINGLLPRCPSAALSCALDVAICDILARQRGIAVASFLSEDPSSQVAVNAVISALKPAAAASAAAAAAAAGFSAVKLKVGMSDGLAMERERVAAVRDELGSRTTLRLDANGAWTTVEAIEIINALEEYDIELVEQPVPPGNHDAMRQVCRNVQVPIAADEDVIDLDTARGLLNAEAAQYLVLKPMIVGGLRPAMEIAKLAESKDCSVIVTTTIDGGIGTAAALHLASALSLDKLACGLATGTLLVSNLITNPLAIEMGLMQLPGSPGLGVQIDEQALERFGNQGQEVRS